MAPSPRTSSRQDATALPSMSSTFWAFMILASLLIAYCSQLAAGTCEIVTLDRDSSQPRRTIARQTARCACRKGQIAGTTRARPACVDARIIKTKQWCDMLPCLEGEGCDLLINRSGWTCTQPGGRIKTTTGPYNRSHPLYQDWTWILAFLIPNQRLQNAFFPAGGGNNTACP
ncbi:chemokine-like protein TAFA-5 isoform X2 [Delphinapterus leucas]|uniref:Chemokine-like protein TAFA-5 isoform X2 n=1 Tax=Delphinapterus leucas TaxID=9749 RepID=A0A2Y9Q0Q5_DELLE|nr:chemokine-like protein TAFA-5 isoform X2 [Delphinapterus leucas]